MTPIIYEVTGHPPFPNRNYINYKANKTYCCLVYRDMLVKNKGGYRNEKRVSLWEDFEIAQLTVDQLFAAQSRCGLLCEGCTFRESHGCTGCIAINGNPFWGECPVAKCCHGKGSGHCGECPDLPCDILREFPCGDSEHCDKPAGVRIEIIRAWATRNR